MSRIYYSKDRQSCAWRSAAVGGIGSKGWHIQTKDPDVAKEIKQLKSAKVLIKGINRFLNVIQVSDEDLEGALLSAGIERGRKGGRVQATK